MKLLKVTALVIGILLGINYITLVHASTPFAPKVTYVTMNIWGLLTITPQGEAQAGDWVGMFVDSVVSGTPTGCVGASQITDTSFYTGSAYGDDTITTPNEKDGAANGDTITFQYYSSKYNDIVTATGTAIFTSSQTVQADLIIDLTPIIPSPENKGTVTLVSPGPPTWTYELTHVSGSITEWTYISTGITGASAPAGWTSSISGDRKSIIFIAGTPMTSGEVSGFKISGTASGTGSWICHNSSGTIDGPVANEVTTLQIFSGDNQTGVVGTTLPNPLVVIAKDQNGNPMSGVEVTFSVIQGGGNVSPAQDTTDASGKAQTILTLGATPGENQVKAQSGNLTVTFTATATDIVCLKGDIDGNSLVLINDAVLLLKHIADPEGNPFDARQTCAADMDDNGVILINDAVLLLKKIAEGAPGIALHYSSDRENERREK